MAKTGSANKSGNAGGNTGINGGNVGTGDPTDGALDAINDSAKASAAITSAQMAANAVIMSNNMISQVANGMMSAATDTVSGVVKLMKDATHASKEAAEKPQ